LFGSYETEVFNHEGKEHSCSLPTLIRRTELNDMRNFGESRVIYIEEGLNLAKAAIAAR
jgi:hypothetical protein